MNVRDARYGPRDRLWLGVNSLQLISTADPVDVEGMRERIHRLAEQEAELCYFRRPGGTADRYRQALDARTARTFAEGMVRPLLAGAGPGTPLEASVSSAMTHDDTQADPIIYVGDGVAGHRISHSLLDGLGAITHLRRLSTGPEPGSTVAPFPLPSARRPLPLALRRRYLRDGLRAAPGKVQADLRMGRFAPPTVPAGPADPAWNPGAGQAPNDVQVVIRQLDADGLQSLKDWRRRRASGTSMASLQIAAIRRGLADAGLIPAEDGMFVAFDLRHTVHPHGADGNFISVPYLKPSDPLDPSAVHDATRAAHASGLPLVQLARGSARASLSRRTPMPAMRRPASRRTVAFSHLRAGPILAADVITRADGSSLVIAATMPPNVAAMSFMLIEHDGRMTVTAVFCSPFTAREPVEDVLTRFAKDPASLLP